VADAYQPLDVVLIKAGDGVAEIDRDSGGEAGCQPEDPLFSSLAALLGICHLPGPRQP
jgi:hypothetical protein